MPFWIGLMTKPVAAVSGVMAEELIKETAIRAMQMTDRIIKPVFPFPEFLLFMLLVHLL